MAKSQDQDIPAHSQRYEKWITTGKEPHEKKKRSPHWPFFSRFYHIYFFKKKKSFWLKSLKTNLSSNNNNNKTFNLRVDKRNLGYSLHYFYNIFINLWT